MTDLPKLGAWGTTPTYGNRFDHFIGGGIRWMTATRDEYGKFMDAKVNHAVVYVGEVDGLTGPQLVEARPGGAGFAPWDSYGESMTWANSFDIYGTALEPAGPLSDQRRALIASTAIDLAKRRVGYGYADFLAIALAQKRMWSLIDYSDPPWWAIRLGDAHRLICSQLVDYCYLAADVHLFSDGRPTGLVSPADLYMLTATT